MLLQRLALLSDLLQGLRCRQLLTKLSLLLLHFLLQFAEFCQGALLMLWRQGFQPQLQARQIGLPGTGIGQSCKQCLVVELKVLCAQGQYQLGQHLVQRVELFRRHDTGQLLIRGSAPGCATPAPTAQLPLDPRQLTLDGRRRAALGLADPQHQRIPLLLQLAAARLQQGAIGDQGKTLL